MDQDGSSVHSAAEIARAASLEGLSPRFILPTRVGRIAESISESQFDAVILLTSSLGRGLKEAVESWKENCPVSSDLMEFVSSAAEKAGDHPFLKDFELGRGKTRLLYGSSTELCARLMIAGICSEKKGVFTVQDLKSSVHCALENLKLALPDGSNAKVAVLLADNGKAGKEEIDHLYRTIVLANYHFDRYLSKPSKRLASVLLDIGSSRTDLFSEADQLYSTQACVGTVLARELCNERGDVANPTFMEDIAQMVAKTHGLGIKVVRGDDLVLSGYNLIHSVGRSSRWPPRIIALEYWGKSGAKKPDARPIVFVGKGITYDTGGLNLKPTGSMEAMYMDKGGSVAVLGAMKALALQKAPVDVVGVLAVAENSVDGISYKPLNIIRTPKGSVEIGNTDAEGRLALADAFTMVQKDYPNLTGIVDLATLTGACVVALGEYIAGAFTNENGDSLVENVLQSGKSTFERCWQLPILDEHRDELKGTYSDFRSTGKGRYGGASIAAAFLEKFVNEGTPWVHIDIAGPAMVSSKMDFIPKDGTGFGAQLLTHLASLHSKSC